jgi:hypothetical protein
MTNKEVAVAWSEGRRAAAGHFSTDGKNLYSYALLIGQTVGGKKVLTRYRVSVTTSKHTNLAARFADEVVSP